MTTNVAKCTLPSKIWAHELLEHQSVITRIVDHRRVIEASIVDDQTSSARALLAAINTASKLLAAVMITLQPATDSLGLTHTACRQRLLY